MLILLMILQHLYAFSLIMKTLTRRLHMVGSHLEILQLFILYFSQFLSMKDLKILIFQLSGQDYSHQLFQVDLSRFLRICSFFSLPNHVPMGVKILK